MTATQQRPGYVFKDRRVTTPDLRPQAYGTTLYATPRSTYQSDFYRQRQWGVGQQGLTQYDWQELLDYSRQLFSQVEDLGHAVCQKNQYAIGDSWQPIYQGDNQAWGDAAQYWLHHTWLPNCDVRGAPFDWCTNLLLSGLALDIDGDDLCIFTTDENGFPKLRFVQAHEITSGTLTNEVKHGWADGARINNGIIVDRQNAFMGARIAGDKPGQYLDIPARNCHLLYDPIWRSQFRGIPRIGTAILTWFDLQDIDTFLKRQVKLESSIGLLHYNQTGEAPSGLNILTGRGTNGTDTGVEASDIKTEMRVGGEIMYMRANQGEKIEAINSGRPHPNTEAFLQRLSRRGIMAVDWYYDLLDPRDLKGAVTRLVQDQARHSVRHRQKPIRPRALRAVQFAVAQGVSIGAIPANPDPDDVLRWSFNMPASITVDAGYEEQADRDNLTLGSTTLAAIAQKRGHNWENIRNQTVVENKNLIDAAVVLMEHAKAAGQELEFREAMDMVQRKGNTPRQLPAMAESDQEPAEPAKAGGA